MTDRPHPDLSDARAAVSRPRRRLAAKSLQLGLIPLIAGGFLAGCGEENAYCVDNAGQVLDNDQCDDDYRTGYYGGHYWAFTGNRKYSRGDTVDPSSQQIAAADRAALSRKSGFGTASNHSSGAGRSFGGGGFGGSGHGSFGG